MQIVFVWRIFAIWPSPVFREPSEGLHPGSHGSGDGIIGLPLFILIKNVHVFIDIRLKSNEYFNLINMSV